MYLMSQFKGPQSLTIGLGERLNSIAVWVAGSLCPEVAGTRATLKKFEPTTVGLATMLQLVPLQYQRIGSPVGEVVSHRPDVVGRDGRYAIK